MPNAAPAAAAHRSDRRALQRAHDCGDRPERGRDVGQHESGAEEKNGDTRENRRAGERRKPRQPELAPEDVGQEHAEQRRDGIDEVGAGLPSRHERGEGDVEGEARRVVRHHRRGKRARLVGERYEDVGKARGKPESLDRRHRDDDPATDDVAGRVGVAGGVGCPNASARMRDKEARRSRRPRPPRGAERRGGVRRCSRSGSPQKEKPRNSSWASKINPRQRPTLPRGLPRSTIGAEGLNGRVRNGNGCGPFAKVTGKLCYKFSVALPLRAGASPAPTKQEHHHSRESVCRRTVLTISRLKYFMVKPHGRLVRVSFTPRSASTPRLSTWSSPTGLQGITPGKSHLEEGFPLICFQRLSFRTSLPGHAAGATTGAQEVRPSRSSRTKDGSSQISCAHTR